MVNPDSVTSITDPCRFAILQASGATVSPDCRNRNNDAAESSRQFQFGGKLARSGSTYNGSIQSSL